MRWTVATTIADICQCEFVPSNIDQDDLHCLTASTNTFSYSGRLTSYVDIESTVLAGYLGHWVSRGPTITVDGVLFRFVDQDTCIENVTEVKSDVCVTQSTSNSGQGSDKAVKTGAPIAAGMVFLAIVVGVITIVLYALIRNRRQRQTSTDTQHQPQLIST